MINLIVNTQIYVKTLRCRVFSFNYGTLPNSIKVLDMRDTNMVGYEHNPSSYTWERTPLSMVKKCDIHNNMAALFQNLSKIYIIDVKMLILIMQRREKDGFIS